jgi:hypothetical protein
MPRTKNEWTLWAVAASCVLHVVEEYLTGWQGWAQQTLGIAVSSNTFLAANAVLVVIALLTAGLGWRRPVLSLIVPSATLINAIFLHLLPTLIQGRVAPGLYTAALLYVPFSSWALMGAAGDGVPRADIATAFVVGAGMMGSVLLAARVLSIVSLGE